MYRLIPVLLLIALVSFGYSWLKRQPPGKKRRVVLRTVFVLVMAALIFLVITGRIHWVGAALAALLPAIKLAVQLAAQFWPFIKQHKASSPPPSAVMTPEEAAEILGIKERFEQGQLSREELLRAHKALIQKVHPDRGGNDYLAARVNQAKEVLMKYV